jgi:hypothetical protein
MWITTKYFQLTSYHNTQHNSKFTSRFEYEQNKQRLLHFWRPSPIIPIAEIWVFRAVTMKTTWIWCHAYQHFRGGMLVCTDKLHSSTDISEDPGQYTYIIPHSITSQNTAPSYWMSITNCTLIIIHSVPEYRLPYASQLTSIIIIIMFVKG